MTDNNSIQPHEELYGAMKSLPGWHYVLESAQEFGGSGPGTRTVGALISSVLLAGGEDVVPIAVTGQADAEAGTGTLFVFYPGIIVEATGSQLRSAEASFRTSVHPTRQARNLHVTTKHSYFSGTDAHPRTRGFGFGVTVDQQEMEFESPNWGYQRSPLTTDEAIYAAFSAIRDQVAEVPA
ncbi:hypothetical protein P2P98_13995 [Microbacterium sp. Kw_RZR3]|uniref:hypothetical protein n=1 Tax=Microbacterium sp. Kw_RZR3 TaxID=3032903 RepID=UPI0023DC7875|nr:hypothetical protein [Microbacterium sp. Kw_RZR3]MDF2047274.1 hypothetical protein [Microbacterium sp. Kw_RZR3]